MYCGIAMFCMMVWALATAKGVSPLMTEGQTVSTGSSWLNTSWLIMSGINQSVGGVAAGILNGSDFSRYATRPRAYVIGTIVSAWVLGILIAFIGLVTTSAAQKIYGEIYCACRAILFNLSSLPKSFLHARRRLAWE
jgi:NCS1 family nucleobase:cation symporter-1